MSLTVALNTAKQSLSANGVQTAIVSRNNAGAKRTRPILASLLCW